MQLILDADNIDIQGNMSTIEQETLSEKFLTDKVIDHLADDLTNGNKENIQKQENIILDVEESNVIDTDKDVSPSRIEKMTNNLKVDNSNEDVIDSEHVQTSEEIADDKNIINNSDHQSEEIQDNLITDNVSKKKPDEVIIENVNNAESPSKENEENSEDTTNTNVTESEDIVILDKDPKANVIEKAVESDIIEVSPNLNEENVSELDKEVDISELSTEIYEEEKLDKEVDIVEVPAEVTKENDCLVNETLDKVTEKEWEKDSVQNEVPIISLPDETAEADCSEVKSSENYEKNDKSEAIEIDDEDEKIVEESAQSTEIVDENVNKNSEPRIEKSSEEDVTVKKVSEEPPQPKRICRLSNNLDIFSDEEDDQPDVESPKANIPPEAEKQCINLDDDDDIMLVDEDSSPKDSKKNDTNTDVHDSSSVSKEIQSSPEAAIQSKNEVSASLDDKSVAETIKEPSVTENKDSIGPINNTADTTVTDIKKMDVDKVEETAKPKKPLLPKNFLNTCKKNLSDMTRNDLEEFCILKIVESIVDRSNLGEIKAHLKNLTQTMEECKNKCLMLTKQNKDLQIVLKSVQEEQKSGSENHITPLKITRSVGMQVMMVADKSNSRKKQLNGVGPQTSAANNTIKQVKNPPTPNTRSQKEKTPVSQPIPVPRLVPAAPPVVKGNQTNTTNTPTKQLNNAALPNGVRNPPPVQKIAEKRPRSQAVTVDLTDDEPPTKLQNVQRSSMNQQMRVLTAAPNLVPAQRFSQNVNSPRKVYIPISGPQAQNVRPGQTIMLKTLTGLGPRPRPQAQPQALIAKAPTQNSVRFARGQPNRHPAPLPDAMKQYQPPNWKSLPPAPDLKLSKVENGIVISWKIDGYQEDDHEEIASYQLYAYQETTSPPNTALWKKIGDVKALPLPMACTLTQFMAGYKYYFAVRAVDIRSRFGPFSLPGSILLLNKM